MMRLFYRLIVLASAALLVGCVGPQHKDVDYTAFRASKPASILVLPPLNASVEPAATAAVLSLATRPLAESGYYVVPVAVMDETFKQNGLDSADDAHAVPHERLREIFGADAALYLTVKDYGARYQVVQSTVTVAIDAHLIDLRNGARLWEGSKQIATRPSQNGGSLLGMMVQAVVDQVANNLQDRSYDVAEIANRSLLSAGPGGMLYGPRSPHYASQ
ncbi:DUF799 domain-containing protein [Bordetella genomosp. 5]|uniref:Lipoprotein n=1 Tax=Bordetella genomosp. 5 TaxID=1395608 RepID=A0A261T976_9BORD|nr:DUF799 domain-containing protein [Bordetella genomosp. 5]OZI45792.1 hypothetical protein CAL25_21450 [Bordetella genomosp. 5]